MLTFGKLTDMINNIRALDINQALFFTLSQNDNKEFIIELNTNEQLFQGVDATNRALESIGGSYSPTTIILKQAEGLPFDRVTLLDTGDFYDSFVVMVGRTALIIEADTFKEGTDLQDRWGDELIGLTDDSIEQLINELAPQIAEYIREQILQ